MRKGHKAQSDCKVLPGRRVHRECKAQQERLERRDLRELREAPGQRARWVQPAQLGQVEVRGWCGKDLGRRERTMRLTM